MSEFDNHTIDAIRYVEAAYREHERRVSNAYANYLCYGLAAVNTSQVDRDAIRRGLAEKAGRTARDSVNAPNAILAALKAKGGSLAEGLPKC